MSYSTSRRSISTYNAHIERSRTKATCGETSKAKCTTLSQIIATKEWVANPRLVLCANIPPILRYSPVIVNIFYISSSLTHGLFNSILIGNEIR